MIMGCPPLFSFDLSSIQVMSYDTNDFSLFYCLPSLLKYQVTMIMGNKTLSQPQLSLKIYLYSHIFSVTISNNDARTATIIDIVSTFPFKFVIEATQTM